MSEVPLYSAGVLVCYGRKEGVPAKPREERYTPHFGTDKPIKTRLWLWLEPFSSKRLEKQSSVPFWLGSGCFFFFFFTLVTGPRRSLSLKLSDT